MANLLAQRDMTAREFQAALARNGFKHDFLFWFKDTTGACPGTGFSGLFRKDGKLCRRATLAHLIKSRERNLAKAVPA